MKNDDTPRDEMRLLLAQEVERTLAQRFEIEPETEEAIAAKKIAGAA